LFSWLTLANVVDESYTWVEGPDPDLDALAIAFVAYPGALADVFRASGNRWEAAERSTMDRVLHLVHGFDVNREPVLLGRLGDWHVLLAPNGFAFSYPGVAAGASRLGRVVSVFWNVNAVMRVLVADGGQITRRFDPLIVDDGTPLPEESGLPFGEPCKPRGARCCHPSSAAMGSR
jgi:Family of unknown function (DUF6461)